MLAAQAEAGQDDLVDRDPVRLGGRLSAAGLERPHDAALDDRVQVVALERARAQDGQPAVPVGPGRPHHLVVGDAQPLAVQVAAGAKAVKEQPAGADPARGRQRQHLVDAAPMLTVCRQLAQEAAQAGVDLEGLRAELFAGGDRDRQGVDLQLGRRSGRQGHPHAQH